MLKSGWYETLGEAAKASGPESIYKKREKKRKGVNKYRYGLPLTIPETFEVEIETEAIEIIEDEAPLDLIKQFELDPYKLTKEEHIELGKFIGIKLMKNWKEETMIAKIKEVVEK